jgi:hypothetical protein
MECNQRPEPIQFSMVESAGGSERCVVNQQTVTHIEKVCAILLGRSTRPPGTSALFAITDAPHLVQRLRPLEKCPIGCAHRQCRCQSCGSFPAICSGARNRGATADRVLNGARRVESRIAAGQRGSRHCLRRDGACERASLRGPMVKDEIARDKRVEGGIPEATSIAPRLPRPELESPTSAATGTGNAPQRRNRTTKLFQGRRFLKSHLPLSNSGIRLQEFLVMTRWTEVTSKTPAPKAKYTVSWQLCTKSRHFVII